MNSPMYIKKWNFYLKNSSTKKTPGPDGFIGKFHKKFKEEIVPVPHKLL